ncbi:Nuclear AAA ATPase (VCP subfamily) [Handroanthus impetiginosus]|uniref:Nuclear AAA ATPase (VCP subfamily) n=1 Tax=Handroanthus impetiginosus TaxID=429701 RepID=A0A2G9I3W2_9LAMI|nr:Nuclear AAA ATPase (VCP subfamily) [Handroanthus impetiginosus]
MLLFHIPTPLAIFHLGGRQISDLNLNLSSVLRLATVGRVRVGGNRLPIAKSDFRPAILSSPHQAQKMGKKGGGNARGSGDGMKLRSNFDRILRRHIESSAKKYATIEQLVDHLRSTYPQYSRHKLQPFTKRVNQMMQISCSRRSAAMDDSDDVVDTPIIKKRRKVDEKEEKLQLLEAQHLRNRSGDVLNSSGGCSSSSLASISSSEGDSMSDEASTSEDAIYGEKFEPEFDLMKSMLRDNLRQKSKDLGRMREANEAVELEIVDNKDTKKVNLVNEEQKSGDGPSKINKNDSSGKDDNDISGPMFKDLGGISGVIEELKMEVIVPLYHPQLPRCLGVKPLSGILLHGPPGCGKTKLAHAIANETGVPFYKISATELVSGVSGASEENIRELFSKAYRTAPSIVFIDEIDAIASKRENLQREMERRIVTQLMTCMDESHRLVKPDDENANFESSNSKPGYVLVIGATNRPDAVDPALRRPGRFDREIVLGVPDESARIEILRVLTCQLKVEGGFDLVKIARSTPGFVGADLAALANKAGNLAMKRIIDKRKAEFFKLEDKEYGEDWWRQPWSDEEMEKLSITMADFEEASKMVQPSSRREGFSSIPSVKWDDVGGLHFLRQEFDRYIVRRIKFPEDYEDFGVDLETGFLLYGPPGCGKTLIAKAVANEAGANFIHIKGPELLNKYVGESELAVRTIFSRARTCSPCILFFDEVDALTTKRGKEGGWVVERLLNQLLIELDGSEQRRGVYVIGATNRPEVMDRAVLRPGRFGKLMYLPLPSPDERGMILKALARKKPIDADVDLMALGRNDGCENLSGADLSALMNEAAMVALEDKLTSSSKSPDGQKWTIKDAHFRTALGKISPSVSDKQIKYYNRLSESFKAA